MEILIKIISNSILLLFNLLIYVQITVFKKDNLANRIFIYTSYIILIGLFLAVTSMNLLPEALASFVCITVPGSILFFITSKYKDFRFFVIFYFLNTITFILGFFIRALSIIYGNIAGIISTVVIAIAVSIIYIKGKHYFQSYRKLIENVSNGWSALAISTLLIYILLIFTATFPKPMIERIEYIPVYMLLSITILSFCTVFLIVLIQKKQLYEINLKLYKRKEMA